VPVVGQQTELGEDPLRVLLDRGQGGGSHRQPDHSHHDDTSAIGKAVSV
jgi:hypothetical protein